MKRSRRLKANPEKTREWQQRSRRRLPPMSQKRIAERDERDAVRARAILRAGGKCQARDLVPEVACWGPLDVDEITPRGVRPGAHLDDGETQVLCRRHHEWKTDNPEAAHERGLRRWSWENTR